MKRYPECAWCQYFDEDKNTPIGCKYSQIKYAFNEVLMALPVLCLFANKYPLCNSFKRRKNEWELK